MEDELHTEEGEEESQAVEECAGAGYGWRCVAQLGNVVVEGQDGPGEIEGGVEHVGEVVAGVEC